MAMATGAAGRSELGFGVGVEDRVGFGEHVELSDDLGAVSHGDAAAQSLGCVGCMHGQVQMPYQLVCTGVARSAGQFRAGPMKASPLARGAWRPFARPGLAVGRLGRVGIVSSIVKLSWPCSNVKTSQPAQDTATRHIHLSSLRSISLTAPTPTPTQHARRQAINPRDQRSQPQPPRHPGTSQ
jgi:hypothetical protein